MSLLTHPPSGRKKETLNLVYSHDEATHLYYKQNFLFKLKCQLPNFFLHKQPGSKMIFVNDHEGNQIRLDAYEFLWKKEFLKK